MKTIKLICKGVLLYITTLVVILCICGIDSIMELGYFIPSTAIVVLLVFVCYKTISEEEVKILTFDKYFNKLIEENKEI